MGNFKDVFAKTLIGIILFIGSFVLLWLNEGNNAKNIATAGYMEKHAIQIKASPVSEANNDSLVAVTGKAVTDNTLRDENVEKANTLVLERTVKMYQWKEKTHEDSHGNESYEYVKEWSSMSINSNEFHDKTHKNPQFPVESETFFAQDGQLGDFELTSWQIENIRAEKDLTELPQHSKYTVVNGKYYSGKNFQYPEIGDLLISYRYAPSGTYISIIGKQQYNELTNFSYKGRYNFVQYNGSYSKAGMIEKYRQDNATLTLILRIVGWFLMFFGLKLLISPLEALLGFVPILGAVANSISTFILFLLSLALSLVTIAIAWFVYRPLLSVALLAVAFVIVVQVKQKLAKKDA